MKGLRERNAKKRKGNYGPEGLKLPDEQSETGKSFNDRGADMTITIIKN